MSKSVGGQARPQAGTGGVGKGAEDRRCPRPQGSSSFIEGRGLCVQSLGWGGNLLEVAARAPAVTLSEGQRRWGVPHGSWRHENGGGLQGQPQRGSQVLWV